MSKIDIRHAHSFDKEAIAKIYAATPELHTNAVIDFHDPDELELALRDQRSIFLIAQDEKAHVCGFAYVKIKNKTISKEKARLIHLVVIPEERKTGAGKLLMKECVARLREQGISDFYSCVNVRNIPMSAFLMHQGFVARDTFYRFELNLRDQIPLDLDHDYGDSD